MGGVMCLCKYVCKFVVLPHKPLVPRTYRVPAGSTLLMGGLARLDVLEHPGATLYLTAWMSSHITLHMGKTEGAEERLTRHAGGLLVPPASAEAWQELPPMRARHVVVEGNAWDQSTVDIHIAGARARARACVCVCVCVCVCMWATASKASLRA
ncbi:hypothetical protein DUNSADRAFT_18742 [Dunaliella salina]|uniref:NOA1/YqeH-like C-terminal domain-containing protein n=1 Tax=Dunaliella salina TaxID=3046 RepID=A0ABQ7GYR2_DUNSA|nr:hypothetical protein DUNSADRAFT_18742 [Dunaliella salina]|eukprot:KAF5839740.1 hypothetical protein DUNSADRAFT_18742 [Dunaliella salina]